MLSGTPSARDKTTPCGDPKYLKKVSAGLKENFSDEKHYAPRFGNVDALRLRWHDFGEKFQAANRFGRGNVCHPPSQLTIGGTNFGVAKPQVTLDGLPLLVMNYTNTKVVAQIPASLDAVPGTYALTLTRSGDSEDDDNSTTANFVAAILAAGAVGPPGPKGDAGQQVLAEAAREQLVTVQQQVGSEVELIVDGGSVAPLVRSVALRKRSDLIVIGRGCIQGGMSRLRANAYATIREAPCPVLSV